MSVDDRRRSGPVDALMGMLAAARLEMCQLRDQLQSRALVGQAQGMVMERLGVEAPQALALLERVSTLSHRSVVEVAARVVLTRELPGIPDVRCEPGTQD